MTLTLNAVTKFYRRTLWLIMLYYQTKFDCKRTSSLEDIVEIAIFWLYKPSLWPCPSRQQQKHTKKLFHVTLWLILQHHHTKFGNKMFCGSEDITGQIFTDIFNLQCDLDLERSNPIFFPQDTLAYNAVLPNWVWLQTDQQFRRYSRNSQILII